MKASLLAKTTGTECEATSGGRDVTAKRERVKYKKKWGESRAMFQASFLGRMSER